MAHVVECKVHRDARGMLTIVEEELPFVPARLFWITDADGHVRGGHGHKRTEMVLFALSGSVRVNVRGVARDETYVLNRPDVGLYLLPQDWHEMELADHGVLLVVASHVFDPEDYVYDPPGRTL
jgi:dTDP-4-dehydrorhamnose 3,5-epimerase-like enzyme